jgi:isocitrate lyase
MSGWPRRTDGSGKCNYDLEAARLKKDWAENPRWKGIQRGYTAEDVVRLRGSVHIEHTLARARRGEALEARQ